MTSIDSLMAGLDRYKHTKPPDREWCNPATWLNQGRWNDAPAASTGHDLMAHAVAVATPMRRPTGPPPLDL